ncbi:MAG: hypothetical protein LBT97_10245, partial [Planctomycetota bacterium]|nr:hypothetical protein [Planctomycetota bacterium]
MFNWKSGLLSAVLFAAVQSTASALDVDEIVDMVNSGVQEAVIINMLEQQKLSRPLTAQEVINLSRAGVSARLMEELTSVGNVRSAYAPAPVATYTPPPPAGNY